MHVKKIIYLIILIVAIAGCASKEEKRDVYYKKGVALFEQADYTKAKLEFKNALQIDPQFALAYQKLGECEARLKNWRKALEYLSKAVELDPGLFDAQLSLAELFIMAKQLDKAKEKTSIVLNKEPENSRALLLNSMILISEDKAGEAEKILRNIIAKDPGKIGAYLTLAGLMEKKSGIHEAEVILKQGLESNVKDPSLLLGLAGLYVKKKDFLQAERIYKNLVQYYPEDKNYVIVLARFYTLSNQAEKAEGVLDSLIRNEPANVDYRTLLARFYHDQKRFDKAIDVLKNAVSDLPGELKLQLLLADMYLKNNQADLSLKTYQDIVDSNPRKPEAFTARNQMARIYFLQKKIDLAAAQLDMVIKDNPKDLDAHFLKGTLFLTEGKGLEAVNEFRFVVDEKPDDPKGYLYLAHAHILNKEKALAMDSLKKALQINPRYKDALDVILNLYTKDKAFDDAIILLKDILSKDPENLLAISYIGNLYLLKGDVARAEARFKELKEKAPGDINGFIKMGLVYMMKKDYAKAQAELDKALSLYPGNIKVLSNAVSLQMFLKKPDIALKKCRQQIAKAPDAEPGIRILMSRVYSAGKRFGDAEAEIRKAMELKPDALEPYAALANLYLKQGKVDKGIEELESALNMKPDSAGIKFTIANLYEGKRDYDNARRWYERTVDEHPKFVPGLNNLAYIYADRYPDKENLDKAIKFLKDIPKRFLNIDILDTFGWVYYQNKDYDKALEAFKQAEAKGDNPTLQLHLGLTYIKMNQLIPARVALEKALEDEGKGLVEKDRKIAQEAMEELEKI
ncbi:MAG: tetratricopeptide repeat protein [Deltaproteobacteria bacterium]|nr:tetratricopeptide repeat protein [Deltaproteobacteria bacterium]